MPLDSDISNADANLHVEFYEKKDSDPAGLIYCRIVVPGDKTFTHDQPARDSDKQRFPRHWLAFNMTNTPEGQVYGTPLRQWNTDDPTGFNENQMIELLAMRFQTVEQIAGMADMQMQRVGMGAQGLKVRAQQYLDSKNRSQDSRKLEETEKALAELQLQMAEVLAAKYAAEVPKPTASERMAIARAARGKGRATNVEHAAPVGDAGHI